jgi:hypothetical protein
MNKKSIILVSSLVILSLLLFVYFNKSNQTADVAYSNDKYGFALTLNEKFNKGVEIKEEAKVVYFVSKEIQAKQPEMIFGVIGRIEMFNKAEFTKETMMESGSAYSLKYLGENESYYFGWAHATDVQVPPGDNSLTKKYRALEKDFAEIIKTFKTIPVLPQILQPIFQPELKTDSGRYVGQADNNFFEVKISGIPDDEKASRVFMISDKVRTKFESLNLQQGQVIKIKYIENEHGQNVVDDIEKI